MSVELEEQLSKLVRPPLILQTREDEREGKSLGSFILIKLPFGRIVLGVKMMVRSVSSPAFVGKAEILWKITVPSVN